MKALLLVVVGVFSSFGLYGQAQASSQIQGTVIDATGSAIPGADVRAIQTDTGAVRTATTETDGAYVLANLPIGPYRLEVSKQGFTTYIQTGIVLQVATNPTVDISLKVGNVSEQVQVEANAALVETQATGVGTVMENRRILELPLNGRVATDLIQYTPAVIEQGVAGNILRRYWGDPTVRQVAACIDRHASARVHWREASGFHEMTVGQGS